MSINLFDPGIYRSVSGSGTYILSESKPMLYKVGEDERQTVRPKTVALFYLMMVVESSKLFCSFYYTLDISTQKIKSLH